MNTEKDYKKGNGLNAYLFLVLGFFAIVKLIECFYLAYVPTKQYEANQFIFVMYIKVLIGGIIGTLITQVCIKISSLIKSKETRGLKKMEQLNKKQNQITSSIVYLVVFTLFFTGCFNWIDNMSKLIFGQQVYMVKELFEGIVFCIFSFLLFRRLLEIYRINKKMALNGSEPISQS
jgi:hypothetical protein